MPHHMEKFVEDTARQRLVREESAFQSEWPVQTSAQVSFGWWNQAAGAGSMLVSVPSSKWFKLRYLWISNDNTTENMVRFYLTGTAADASGTLGGIWIAAKSTEFIALEGITTNQDIYASALVASLFIRAMGVLVDSGPE